MAEVSYKRRVVGDIAWAMGTVPVKRAQDSAEKGIGKISIQKDDRKDALEESIGPGGEGEVPATFIAKGTGTAFTTNLHVGRRVVVSNNLTRFSFLVE